MKYSRFQLFAATIALILCACTSDENTDIHGIGWITFDLRVDETPEAPASEPFSLSLQMDGTAYAHTWPNIGDVQTLENFYVGSYSATAVSGTIGAEGYDCPCYMAEANFDVKENQRTIVPLEASITQALVMVSMDESLTERYPGATVTMHSAGHGYISVSPIADKPMLLSPGYTQAMITLPVGDESVTIAPNFAFTTACGASSTVQIGFAEDVLTIQGDGKEASILLSEDILNSPIPTATASGFTPGTPLVLTEGYPSEDPISITLHAPAGLSHAVLTSSMPDEVFGELPRECDLLSDPAIMEKHGLEIHRNTDDALVVDFSKLIEDLSVTARTSASFTLVGYDMLGRVSQPMTLSVSIASVYVEEIWQTPAVIGEDQATVHIKFSSGKIQASDISVHILDNQGAAESKPAITEAAMNADSQIATIKFMIEPGVNDVPVRIDYMGVPETTIAIGRRVPEYQMTVDAFATTAKLMINAGDEKKTQAIVRYASVLANGKQTAIYRRDLEHGMLIVAGLHPSTTYTIEPIVITDGFSVKANITTESASDVPEGDFEDFTDLIKYLRMPMGGAFSATAFPIYSQQNYIDFDVKWVKKYWASVNDKTFCRSAATHNTWYMQPSSVLDFDSHASGGKSMKICSVGWSLDGEEIKPYAQQPDEYLPYNNNVPYVAHRSAGKLFLGKYTFEPATMRETYAEGVAFSSRPSALNGFYRYTPAYNALNDCGVAIIEILGIDNGQEITIASASLELHSAPDFVSFSIPLTYPMPGIKAIKLKIMFASSSHTGTIEEEDANVPVIADVADAIYIGSTLWIDNLTFSY